MHSLLKPVAALFVGTTLSATALMAQAALPNGVSAGDVSADSVVLWARTTVPGDVRFTLRKLDFNPRNFKARPVQRAKVNVTDPEAPAKLVITGLDAGTRYVYEVRDREGAYRSGTFRTADAPGVKRGLRFGVSGDWRGELSPYPAIANAWQRNLNFFVKLGDTIYADFPSPAVPQAQAESLIEYRQKHEEVYSKRFGVNAWARLQAFTPIFATIDDHEVINDFAGGAPAASDARFNEPTGLINQTPLYRNGLRAFTEYNAIEDLAWPVIGDARTDARPDLYRARRFGDAAAMFMLDGRSFRDAELPGVQNPLDPAQVGAFLAGSFNPTRTLLGQRQLQRLFDDLLAAQHAGVTWKFIFVPEPIQNLGVIGASDRFEGYAAERTAILKFIDDNAIPNVVFVSADIHGTLVNNLTYQLSPLQPQIATNAFEISTGSVAFDAPFGPTVLGVAANVPVAPGVSLLDAFLQQIGVPNLQTFNALPEPVRNTALEQLVNQQIIPLGYDPLGLEPGGPIDATLIQGSYTAVFNFGWSEFDIDDKTQALRVTTYGIDPYTQSELEADPTSIVQRKPRIIGQFVVKPNRRLPDAGLSRQP